MISNAQLSYPEGTIAHFNQLSENLEQLYKRQKKAAAQKLTASTKE